MQVVLSALRKAIDKYNMISNGDKIAVGVSGGKDSLVLLKALKMYQRFSPEHFELVAITIDAFNHPEDFNQIKDWCQEQDIEYHIIPSDIYSIVFEQRQEKSPCSLCAKLRRGMLCTHAIELGCNKLALGHTMEDVMDTFFLSMLYEGRLNTFLPVTYLSRTGISVIRPLVFLSEHTIKFKAKSMPVVQSRCPVNKHTKREEVRKIINNINQEIPIAKDRIFSAIISDERYNLFDKSHNPKDN